MGSSSSSLSQRKITKVKHSILPGLRSVDTTVQDLARLAAVNYSDSDKQNLIDYPPCPVRAESVTSPDDKRIYSSMSVYRQDLALKLLVEEKAWMCKEQNQLLTNDNSKFYLRYEEGSKSRYSLGIEIPLTAKFVETFMTRKLQEMNRSPFFKDQTMFILKDEERPIFGFVESAFIKEITQGFLGNETSKVIKVFIKTYSCSTQKMPDKKSLKAIQIMPASVGVSRAFKALASISNHSIQNMLLGTVSVEQKAEVTNLKFSNFAFNSSQKNAVKSALTNPVTILRGPPGTGKTCTIIEMINQFLKRGTYPILVVAASNTAVDNIAEKLIITYPGSILRISAAARESYYDDQHPLQSICLHSKVKKALPEDVRKLLVKLNDPSQFLTAKEYKRAMNVRNPLSEKFVAESKVILTTAVAGGGPQFKKVVKIPVIIMDEATQCAEYMNLIPLAHPGIKHVILVGDEKQLSGHAESPAVAVSLFERVVANETFKPKLMLDTQYRMHPSISEFSRNMFYSGILKDGISRADRTTKGVQSNPVVFWDTEGQHPESFSIENIEGDKQYSFCNLGEVKLIEMVVIHLISKKKIEKSRIGIISPYGGQRTTMSSSLAKNKHICPKTTKVEIEKDKELSTPSKPVTIYKVAGLTIASIDAFQGREKDFIVISCVRSNPENKVGFLADERRLNVALTRARYGLILVGDVNCLKQGNPLWKTYIEYLETRGCILRNNVFKYG